MRLIVPDAGGGMSIGGSISGGTATRVLFEGAGPVLADDADFTFDTSTNTLSVNNINGGTASTLGINDEVILFASQGNLTAGQNVFRYNPTYSHTAASGTVNDYTFDVSPTLNVSVTAGAAVSSPYHFNVAPTITFNSGLACIYRVFNYSGSYTTTANPGFASAFNLFYGQPTFNASSAGITSPSIAGMYVAGPIYAAGNAAVGTVLFERGYLHGPTYSCTGASSTQTVSLITGLECGATFNANTSGSKVTVSSRKGVNFANFATTLTGEVVVTENIGLDFANQTQTTGTGAGKVTNTLTCAVRSAQTSGTGMFFLNDTGGAQSALAGQFTKYNNITLVGCGIPSDIATINVTTQSAAIATATLYAVPATPALQYELSWNAKVTRAGTTSTLGGLTITYTDPDGVVQTISAGAQLANGTIALTATTNNTTTVLMGYTLLINAKASTNIQYAFAYASTGGTAMQYNLNILLKAC